MVAPAKCRLLDIVNATLDKYFTSNEDAAAMSMKPAKDSFLEKDTLEHHLIVSAFSARDPVVALLALNGHLSRGAFHIEKT